MVIFSFSQNSSTTLIQSPYLLSVFICFLLLVFSKKYLFNGSLHLLGNSLTPFFAFAKVPLGIPKSDSILEIGLSKLSKILIKFSLSMSKFLSKCPKKCPNIQIFAQVNVQILCTLHIPPLS